MKILFVYPGYIVREVPLNVLYVSAAVKAAGHETRLFHYTPYRNHAWHLNIADRIATGFRSLMREFQPDIVGFSVLIQDFMITKRLSRIARKEFKAVVIWGGIQAVLQPKECISEPEVDYICTGEGEYAFPEFVESLQRGSDPLAVKGIWTKDSRGNVLKNDRPDLVSDLDALPFPDRDLLPPEYYQVELTGANILTARGCPFLCAFCQNKRLMEIYRGKGKFVRYRSYENIFLEMETLINRYDAPSFYFSDEIFTLDKNRVIEFCQAYKQRIGRPFMVQTRVDRMDAEVARSLRDAGCFMVNMAIESGNDHIRNKILKKNISRSQIFEAYRVVQEEEMMTSSFNMIGSPGESLETLWETIEINRDLQPNRILCSIFMPLPGTELWEYCMSEGMLGTNIFETTNYYSQVVVRHPRMGARTLIGYQGFFDWYVLLPRKYQGLVDMLRHIYQMLVVPHVPKTPLMGKFRELLVETAYQSKRFLPQKSFHVKTR